MENIELVIKIPKIQYDHILKSDNSLLIDYINKECMMYAIKTGVPLPENHGKLKDTDAICKDIISTLGIRNENYLLEAEKVIYKKIKNASTIIEAVETERNNKK